VADVFFQGARAIILASVPQERHAYRAASGASLFMRVVGDAIHRMARVKRSLLRRGPCPHYNANAINRFLACLLERNKGKICTPVWVERSSTHTGVDLIFLSGFFGQPPTSLQIDSLSASNQA
jgi:hypothetical protein